MDDESAAGLPGWGDEDAVLSGTPAFDALFAALEHAVPLGDQTLLGLLAGSSLAAFG